MSKLNKALFQIVKFDHVQLAIPKGKEDLARAFYVNVLDFEEVEKPNHLKVRGGLWLKQGECNLHLGVEEDFRANQKAHPAFLLNNDGVELRKRLVKEGYSVKDNGNNNGFFSKDCFYNRLEFICKELEKS